MTEHTQQLRAARKLLRAVSDLHLRGYQQLRILPYLGPTAVWRCVLIPAVYTSRSHGARIDEQCPEVEQRLPSYSAATGKNYWGWQDTHRCRPSELAGVLLDRFEDVFNHAYGPDWCYAGWYQQMLHLSHPGGLPYVFSEFENEADALYVYGVEGRIPLPPQRV